MVEGVYMGQHCWGNQRLTSVVAQQHFIYVFFPHMIAWVVVQCPVIFVAFLRVELNKVSNM